MYDGRQKVCSRAVRRCLCSSCSTAGHVRISMIEELLLPLSERAFALKTGTLYPLLHSLEEKGSSSAPMKKMRARRALAATTIWSAGNICCAKKKSNGRHLPLRSIACRKGASALALPETFTHLPAPRPEQLRWKRRDRSSKTSFLTHLLRPARRADGGWHGTRPPRPQNPFV